MNAARRAARFVAINAAVLAGSWLFALALRLLADRFDIPQGRSVVYAILVASVIGAAVARRLGAELALLVILASATCVGTAFAGRVFFGFDVFPHGEPKLTAFATAAIGVGLGFWAGRWRSKPASGVLQREEDPVQPIALSPARS